MKWIFIFLLVFLVVLGSGCIANVGNSSSNNSENLNRSDNGTFFEGWGISFNHSMDWNINTTTNSSGSSGYVTVVHGFKNSSEAKIMPSGVTIGMPPQFTVLYSNQTDMNRLIDDYKKMHTSDNCTKLISENTVEIDGVKGTELFFKREETVVNTPLEERIIIFQKNNKSILIIFSTMYNLDQIKEDMELIINTLHVK